MAAGRAARHGDHVLRRARDLPEDVLRDPKTGAVGGQAAALEPRTRRPATSPNQTTDEVKAQAIGVRAALEQSGLDHGPISIHEKMRSLGMSPVPSTASLSRIFRDTGVDRAEPRKKPRASYSRFDYPAPNACWQLDATEYVLSAGRKCVIFQLIDDHSRFAAASHAAWGETSEGAIAVVKKAITAHGVPQRLLSDNGAALNPSRRGVAGQLVTALGVEAITGKPYKPTIQGKNERFHQTSSAGSTSNPSLAPSRNFKSRSTGSMGSTTPSARTRDCPAESPRTRPGRRHRKPTRPDPETSSDPSAGTGPPNPGRQKRIVQVRLTRFHIIRALAGQTVYLVETTDYLLIFDHQGTQLMQPRWPRPGVRYVGSGRPRGRRPKSI